MSAVALVLFLSDAGRPDAAWAQGLPAAPASEARSLPGLAPAAEPGEPPGLLQRLLLEIRLKQQELQRELTGLVRSLSGEDPGRALFYLFLASFLYGVFHAAGPGHGKIVISSYLLASEDQIRRGVALTFLTSAAQAVSAIVMVGVLAILLDASGLTVTHHVRTLEIVSYGLVIAIGLWMLVTAIQGKGCGHAHGVPHSHGAHDHSCGHGGAAAAAPSMSATGLRQYLGVIMAVGVRPCSGAVIVLLFTLAQGVLWAGIGATFVMALGTALVVATLAILSVGSRRLALRLAGESSSWQRSAQMTISVAGSLVVLGAGALLLAATLDQTVLL